MNGTTGNWLVSLIGFLPFLFALVVFILYLITQSWQNAVRKGLNQFRIILRQSQEESNQIRTNANSFSSDDPEPYGRLSQDLTRQLTEVDQLILNSYRLYSSFNQELRLYSQSKLMDLWRLPWDWRRLKEKMNSSERNLDEIRALLANARITDDQIKGVSWHLSQQCHDLISNLHQMDQLLLDAQDLFIDENEVFHMREKLSDWKKTFDNQVPAFFLSTDPNVITEKADKNTTSRVYRIVQASILPVDNIHKEIVGWIDRAKELSDTLVYLDRKKEEVSVLTADISAQAKSPVIWVATQRRLQGLTDLVQSIGPFEVRRTSTQLKDALAMSKKAVSEIESLVAYLYQVRNLCNEVNDLWMTPELHQGNEWIRRALAIDPGVMEYNAANWLDTLPQDILIGLQELESHHKRITPRDQSNPIYEKELDNYVGEVRTLYKLHQNHRPKYDDFRARLNMIQQVEKETREQLIQTLGVIQKAKPLISSNSLLRKLVGSELDKLEDQVKQSILGFDQTATGVVEKKAKKSLQLLEKTRGIFGKWVNRIQEENLKDIYSLSENYVALTQIVKLDEPFVMQTGKFLEQVKAPEPLNLTQVQNLPPLLELSRELFKASEVWQNCESLGKAIHDIANPVLERIRKTELNRQTMFESLEKAGHLMPERATWPPTTQFLTDEHKLFKQYEDQWNMIRQSKMQAMILVGKLSDLSEHYHELVIRLVQKIELAKKEQDKVREYEKKLAESKRLWIRVADSNSSNRALKSDVNQLIETVEQEYNELMRRYERGGLPYSGALSSLRLLCRKIDDAMMPMGGNQVIDINGVLQKRIY